MEVVTRIVDIFMDARLGAGCGYTGGLLPVDSLSVSSSLVLHRCPRVFELVL